MTTHTQRTQQGECANPLAIKFTQGKFTLRAAKYTHKDHDPLAASCFGKNCMCSSVAVFAQDGSTFGAMPCSALARTKRAFVAVLLSIARTYSLTLKTNRDSEDNELLQAYRRLVKKAHPDKGGDKGASASN